MKQFFLLILNFLILFLPKDAISSDRFVITNSIKNGEVSTKESSIFDLNLIDEVLTGIDENTYPVEYLKIDWDNILVKKSCTNYQFHQSFDYIKFLFFLTRVTLNYEILLDIYQNYGQLKLQNEKYFSKIEQAFDLCNPKSPDMEKFVLRVKNYIKKQDILKVDELSKMKGHQKEKLEILDINNPLEYLVRKICLGKNNCSNLGKELEKEFDGRLTQLKLACDEKDGDLPDLLNFEMINLVKRSSAIDYLSVINSTSNCVDRFINEYIRKDNHVDDEIIRVVMRNLVERSIPYLQGRLFMVGSLKEFDLLGVGNDLFEEIKVTKSQPLPPVAEIKKIIKKEPIIIKKEIKKIVQAPPVVKVEKVKVNLSALKLAKEELIKTKSNIVALDMEELKDDFIFSDKVLTNLHRPLAIFQTRKALMQMKQFDYLGDIKAPVRLLFLKYLIDNGYHQGLFNIVSVLGDKFYILNDIDQEKEPYYISLKNDVSTNNKWQIFVLRTP